MKLSDVKIKNDSLPETPGVYLMKNASGKILYVGKAANLQRRVSSYFTRPHDERIEKLVSEIHRIDYEETETAIEALIREADLIKKLEPPFNVREKDDKSFLFVLITKEKFPRVLLVRGRDVLSSSKGKGRPTTGALYGPFTSAKSLREALKIIRRIFPWSDHPSTSSGQVLDDTSRASRDAKKPCFNYQIGLCPGTCAGLADAKEYRKTIANLKLFFAGKRQRVRAAFEREMRAASKRLDYETAEKYRRRVFALQHIQDVALISEDAVEDVGSSAEITIRIEGYDISNISGTSAVGSMVVFENSRPAKEEYRKFRIRGVARPDDTRMLREVITRRFHHPEWRRPDLLLIDGGVPQVNAVQQVLRRLKQHVPVVGLAKGPERKRNDVVGTMPGGIELSTLIRVRDEAHRFAVQYHTKVRARNFLPRS